MNHILNKINKQLNKQKEAEMIMNSLHEFTIIDMTQCNKFVENRTSHFEILVC